MTPERIDNAVERHDHVAVEVLVDFAEVGDRPNGARHRDDTITAAVILAERYGHVPNVAIRALGINGHGAIAISDYVAAKADL